MTTFTKEQNSRLLRLHDLVVCNGPDVLSTEERKEFASLRALRDRHEAEQMNPPNPLAGPPEAVAAVGAALRQYQRGKGKPLEITKGEKRHGYQNAKPHSTAGQGHGRGAGRGIARIADALSRSDA